MPESTEIITLCKPYLKLSATPDMYMAAAAFKMTISLVNNQHP
jgi:hypothetical protein